MTHIFSNRSIEPRDLAQQVCVYQFFIQWVMEQKLMYSDPEHWANTEKLIHDWAEVRRDFGSEVL